jgi:hypothetical protein
MIYTIDFKGHTLQVDAYVDKREAPDVSRVEITSVDWNGKDVWELLADVLSGKDLSNLEDKIVEAHNEAR